jgi:hypothetical protein
LTGLAGGFGVRHLPSDGIDDHFIHHGEGTGSSSSADPHPIHVPEDTPDPYGIADIGFSGFNHEWVYPAIATGVSRLIRFFLTFGGCKGLIQKFSLFIISSIIKETLAIFCSCFETLLL